ncbi:hypothetical protein NE857_25255 [Nocardiopsis exhalans]|uniref:Uncharacterized protein n=1 Tax=Nocardiopsis exhalans TaxID=163604 RepID=A0ABY5D5Q8_9ACTN|nr:hypothetical protein [Nocardiopsis exhalans]USY18578.1 hypothetical protein NE857_25255 [Nocardiopsis exhalans]
MLPRTRGDLFGAGVRSGADAALAMVLGAGADSPSPGARVLTALNHNL